MKWTHEFQEGHLAVLAFATVAARHNAFQPDEMICLLEARKLDSFVDVPRLVSDAGKIAVQRAGQRPGNFQQSFVDVNWKLSDPVKGPSLELTWQTASKTTIKLVNLTLTIEGHESGDYNERMGSATSFLRDHAQRGLFE